LIFEISDFRRGVLTAKNAETQRILTGGNGGNGEIADLKFQISEVNDNGGSTQIG
jgi:hypothetical protein